MSNRHACPSLWLLDFGPTLRVVQNCALADLLSVMQVSRYFRSVICEKNNFYSIIRGYVFHKVYVDGLFHPSMGGREGMTGELLRGVSSGDRLMDPNGYLVRLDETQTVVRKTNTPSELHSQRRALSLMGGMSRAKLVLLVLQMICSQESSSEACTRFLSMAEVAKIWGCWNYWRSLFLQRM